MGLLKNLKPNEVKVRLKDYKIMVIGEPKTGKTSLFYNLVKEYYKGDFSKGLLLGLERGYSSLDGIMALDINDYDTLIEAIEELEEDRSLPFEFVCIDTVDLLVKFAIEKTLQDSKKATGEKCKSLNDAFKGYGRGREYALNLIDNVLTRLERLNIGMFLIAHSKLKKKNLGVSVENEEYMELCTSMEEKFEALFIDKMDMIVTLVKNREIDTTLDVKKRRAKTSVDLVFRGDGILSGGRFTNLPDKVPYNSVQDFLTVFENAVKGNMTTKKTDEEIQKIAEKQEIEAKQAEAEALTKVTDEEMFDYFREHFNELGAECKTKIQQIMLSNGVDDITKLLSNHEALVAIYDLIK